MRTERLDLRLFRNADYFEGWQINDIDGDPIDLTDVAMDLFVRAVAGQGTTLATGIITRDDSTQGLITVRISGGTLDAVGGHGEIVRLAYDLRLTYPDGVTVIPVAGQIILTPGVTY